MTTRTRAAVLRSAAEGFQVEEITLEDLASDEVLVKIVGAGMCHTDLVARHSLEVDPGRAPIILGHEGAGVVEAVGSGTSRVAVGDHVVISFSSCGQCRSCLRGDPAYCTEFRQLNSLGGPVGRGIGARDSEGRPVGNRFFGQSSFAGHSVTTERNLVVVDQDLPLELFGPFGCGLQTGAGAVLNEMQLRPDQSIAVFGAGGVGLAAVMAAKLSGASEIVVVDLHQSRLELASELGATRTILGAADELLAEVVGSGLGLDFTFDTTGVTDLITTAVAALAPHGKAVLVSVGTGQLAISPYLLAGRQATFVLEGNAVPQLFIPQLIRYWKQGRFPFDKVVRTYALEDINRAEADSLSGATIKPILLP